MNGRRIILLCVLLTLITALAARPLRYIDEREPPLHQKPELKMVKHLLYHIRFLDSDAYNNTLELTKDGN